MNSNSSKLQRRLKWVTATVLVALLGVSLYLLFDTETGQKIREHPRLLRDDVQLMVHRHPLGAAGLLVGTYVVLASLGLLPVWWLQILAGMAFGLWWGVWWCLIAATISAVLGMLISRWFAAEWFHQRVEAKMERLKKLDLMLGHNGFLLVMSIRLVHMLPFGLCNYALGLIKVSVPDMIVGTFLGSIPAISLSVGIGAGYRPRDWRFATGLVAINLVLLVPLGLRYWRPGWFRKIGVE